MRLLEGISGAGVPRLLDALGDDERQVELVGLVWYVFLLCLRLRTQQQQSSTRVDEQRVGSCTLHNGYGTRGPQLGMQRYMPREACAVAIMERTGAELSARLLMVEYGELQVDDAGWVRHQLTTSDFGHSMQIHVRISTCVRLKNPTTV